MLFCNILTQYGCFAQLQWHAFALKLLDRPSLENEAYHAFERVAHAEKLPQSLHRERYNAHKTQIDSLFLPILFQKCKWIAQTSNFTVGVNKEQKQKQIALLKTEIYKSMRDALSKDFKLWSSCLYFFKQDRILSMLIMVKVEADASLLVTENISIYNGDDSQGRSIDVIQRGIFRDFPIEYKTKFGFLAQTSFALQSVSLNKQEVAHRVVPHQNGIRLYIGDPNQYLPNGIFTYQITYRTTKQLWHLDDYDELYWNATGQQWQFPIDEVLVKVLLPECAIPLKQAIYVGNFDTSIFVKQVFSKEQDTLCFAYNKKLNAGSGLTFAIAFPKGFVIRPLLLERFENFIKYNYLNILLFLILCAFFIFNLFYLYKYLRTKAKMVIVPQFNPPSGLSPADAGMLWSKTYSSRLLVAALVDLAVRQCLTITLVRKKTWYRTPIYRLGVPQNMAISINLQQQLAVWYPFELEQLDAQIIQKNVYNKNIGNLNHDLKEHLQMRLVADSEDGKKGIQLYHSNEKISDFAAFFYFISAFLLFILSIVQPHWGLLYLSGFGWLAGFLSQFGFSKCYPRYTPSGYKAIIHLFGFRKYLSATELLPLDSLQDANKSLEIYNQFLPYAIALRCETAWTKKFKSVLDNQLLNNSTNYNQFRTNFSASNSFSSNYFRGAIAGASTAPGSGSGGSSGGGSAGGGGGGGGGGGW